MEMEASAAAKIDLNFPICISSDDEEEDGPIYISSDDEEVIEIQDPIIPPSSRAPITTTSALASGSSSLPAAADRKGKRKLSSQGTVDAYSQLLGRILYCAICMESVPGALKFIVSPCRQAFCLSCTVQYIAAKVGENVVHVRCPDPSCRDGAVELEDCRGLIPSDLFVKWDLALCESAAELGVGEKKVYCPFRDCSAPLLAGEGMTGEGSIAEADCPHCRRLFCARCMVPWHDGVGCEEFQGLGEHERGREDVMLRRLAGAKRWQRCPHCRMYVERSQGCPFMRCRCGCCFCYTCGSLMCKQLHYCTRCNRG
ncbi:probable E3 ubiquitin-protein ligase RNF217 [Panicum virgatum]|nr:probable E3 ubiquitin-protein ligase RNF217 [Panicum virgatum]